MNVALRYRVMARATRQSARLVSKSSDTATPTSNASPYFSSRPESLITGAETPITSDVEGDANETAPPKTKKSKRVVEVTSDDEHLGGDNAQAPPPKRRAIANRSYVVLERRSSAKGKEKVFLLSLS